MSDGFIKCQIICRVFVCFFLFNPQTQLHVSWPTFCIQEELYMLKYFFIFLFFCNLYLLMSLQNIKGGVTHGNQQPKWPNRPFFMKPHECMANCMIPSRKCSGHAFFTNHYMIYTPFTIGLHKCTNRLWACNSFTNHYAIWDNILNVWNS